MSILDRTENLIDLYVYAQGESLVPKQYHTWAFISLMAACLQDRVYMTEVAKQPLFPNMYIVLWGESGGGKSLAISSVFNIAEEDEALRKFINAQHGRATFQSIADMMGKTTRRSEMGLPLYEQPKVWWTMDELANGVGDGPRANDFIKGVTELYYCKKRYTDMSRTYGVVVLEKPVLNWLAGTTPDWYTRTVKKDGVSGGFQPRVFTIRGEVSTAPGASRTWPPLYPKDYKEVMDVVRQRLWVLCNIPILDDERYRPVSGSGEYTLHEEVKDKLAEWQHNRPPPADDSHKEYWNQEGAKLRKLLMVLSAAERPDLLIMPRHYKRAEKMLKDLAPTLPHLLRANTRTRDTEMVEAIGKHIHRRELVKHSDLLVMASSKGYKLQDVKVARQHLYEMGKIEYRKSRQRGNEVETFPISAKEMEELKRGLWYKWVKGQAPL